MIADHHATCENELSVKAGDIVRVIKKDEETGTYIQPRVMWRAISSWRETLLCIL